MIRDTLKHVEDLAIGVAVGSSTQVALFVVPCAVQCRAVHIYIYIYIDIGPYIYRALYIGALYIGLLNMGPYT